MARIPEPFIRNDYRGLNDAEDDLLNRTLRRMNREIRSLETNVHLGPGEVLPDYVREEYRRGWQESSKLKVDAIVETPSEWLLIELKDYIRTSALGQLLDYEYWFQVERDINKPTQTLVSGPDINPSVVQPLRFNGVEILVLTQQGELHVDQGATATPPF